MRTLLLGITLFSFGFVCADAAKTKDTVPPILLSSHYVYVEALDGDQFDPHLIPEDRQAIADVQRAIQSWKRYVVVTVKRSDAELIFIVRKANR